MQIAASYTYYNCGAVAGKPKAVGTKEAREGDQGSSARLMKITTANSSAINVNMLLL